MRREEQVLLNNRLAMMEEQVQMLNKLITQREQQSQPAPPRPAVIDLDGDANESTEVPTRSPADAGAVSARSSSGARAEITEISPDVPMPDIPANTTAGSETAAVGTSQNNDAPIGIVEYSPNVSMDGSADVFDETPAESGVEILDDTAEAQIDANDSPGTIDAPTAAEADADAEPEGTGAVQATESANEDSPATSISEEE